MLRLVTGSFLHSLEPALVAEVRRLKADDPLAPLAVVVPSRPLRDRLQELLVVESGCALLNVHFLTFHQLALRLDEERRRLAPSGAAPLSVGRDLFFEQLLRHLGRRRLSGTEALGLEQLPAGGWAALWATLRDLKDAAVDPARARDAVDEGQFGTEDGPKLRALFTLQAALREAASLLGVGTADDLAAAVTPFVPASPFLAGLRAIFYYGFYDLTQVQLSFLEAVVETGPATIFFPLEEGQNFEFARRFFDQYVRALGPAEVVSPAAPRPADGPDLRVMNAVGPDDEVALVCKEILSLVEDRGYAFEEIGVVARGLGPYQEALPRLFGAHRIPFETSAGRPLIAEPAAKVLAQLARLPLTGFYRGPMLEVLGSSYARGERGGQRVEPRPDLWRAALSALGIVRGEAEWQRLAAAGQLAVAAGREPEEEEAGSTEVPAAQLALLWRLVSGLMADCRALPAEGLVGELTEAFLALANRHLLMPGLSDEPGDEACDDDEAARLAAAIREVFAQLRELDRIPEPVTWEEWTGLFTRAMERAVVPLSAHEHRGVLVLDAMAARGLPFRALFLLGLNDGVFPRNIHEDAFLRDRHRRVLAATLGYKLDEKLAAHDEERLLFTLLRGAARDRLYLSYQRADVAGRSLAPSPYLAAVRPAGFATPPKPELALPRRLSDRFALPQWAPRFLTGDEVGLWLVLTGRDPGPWLEATNREPALFRNGREALVELEGGASTPGPYDGRTGPLETFWAGLAEEGLAPTSLEQYARCPFQYFAGRVLRLEPLRPPAVGDLPAQTLGHLCHEALRLGYERLVAAGWPDRRVEGGEREALLSDAVERAFAEYEAGHGAGPALLWGMAREAVAGLVREAAEADEAEFLASGFRPVGFEVEARGRLDGDPPVALRGRWDRLDRSREPPGLRVVDYKFRQGSAMKSEDRNLARGAVRGYRLQPPLYSLMVRKGEPAGGAGLPQRVTFVFLAPRWEHRVQRATFEAAAWTGETGAMLKATLRTLLEGIRAGEFLILPDGYCDHCDFASICRRFHEATWWRARRAEMVRRLRDLRKKTPPEDGADE